MGEGGGAAGGGLAKAALGFGLAALFSSWNPLAAPFGLVVGLAAAFLSVRALVTGRRRGLARVAFAVSLLAVAASGAVLALTASLGRARGGAAIVNAPSPGELDAKLRAAAEETRASRERARRELDELGPGAPPKGRPGEGKPGPKGEPRR